VREAPFEHSPVAVFELHVDRLEYLVGPGLLVGRPQVATAQHRNQGDGHERRGEDRARGDDAEFSEEAADDAGHEGDRYEDCGDRERCCDHRKSNLLGGIGSRLGRLLAGLHVSIGVLEYDDRVVDQQADRQGERHQCHRVEREAEEVEEREAADDRARDREGGDQGGAHVAQEEKYDQRSQQRAERERDRDVLDRAANEDRGVARDQHLVAPGAGVRARP